MQMKMENKCHKAPYSCLIDAAFHETKLIFIVDSRVGFTRSVDPMALFPVGPDSIGTLYAGENDARGVIRCVTI